MVKKGMIIISLSLLSNIAWAIFPISRADKAQRFPDVCFGKGRYFVAWQDTRSDASRDIYGARVSTKGKVLDVGGIVITAKPHGQEQVVVGYGDNKYFAIWTDYRNNRYFNIYGARIGALSGDVLDPDGFRGNEVPWDQLAPDGCFGEKNFLTVSTDNRKGNPDIYGARVSTDGVILDPGGVVISEGNQPKGEPRVVFARGGNKNLLVVWHDYANGTDWDIYGAIINRSLNVIKSFPISTANGDQRAPDVGFDGTNYLVTWQDKRSGKWNINGARVSQTGNVLDPAGIRTKNIDWDQLRPRIAFDGTNYLVVFQNFKDDVPAIYACRIDKDDGKLLDVQGKRIVLSSDTAANPSVAFDGENYLVVWEQWTNGEKEDADIWGTLVDKDVKEVGIEKTGFVMPDMEPKLSPNPFSFFIKFQLPSSRPVKVKIYDVSGKLVHTLSSTNSATLTWDGTDSKGRLLPNGVYFARVISEKTSAIKSLVLVR